MQINITEKYFSDKDKYHTATDFIICMHCTIS